MNIYLPGEGGENVELSPFAITAEIYRDSAPASEASSSSSRRSSASDTTVASYKTADDHPGDPPNYSVLEPLLTPEEPHPIRPSLHRFQFCLPDPPKTYWTPTPGGPLRTCSLEDLEAGKKGKEMLKQIIEARKGAICEDFIHGEPSDTSFSYMIIPHDEPAVADDHWLALVRNGRERQWRPLPLKYFAKLVEPLDKWLNESPEHWCLARQHLYLCSVDENGHPSEWHDGERHPRRLLKAILDPDSTPRPGDDRSRSSESSRLVTPQDRHAVLPKVPPVDRPKDRNEPKDKGPASPARKHRGQRHRRRPEDLARPPIRPPKGGDWSDWTGTRESKGKDPAPSPCRSRAGGTASATKQAPVLPSASRPTSASGSKSVRPVPSPGRNAPSGTRQSREEDVLGRSSSERSSRGTTAMRRTSSAASDLNASAPVFVPRRASSSSIKLASTAASAQVMDADATPRPSAATRSAEGLVPTPEQPPEVVAGSGGSYADAARAGASTGRGVQMPRQR